jgi:hypothetical protein
MILKLHKGTVTKGRFIPDNPQAWATAYCGHEGKRIQITVEREKRARSINQNNYYWGVVIALISETTGMTPEETHTALRNQFLKKVMPNGMETAKSTTDLSTAEMEDYLKRIRQWADVFFTGSLYIPAPNENMEVVA